MRLRDIDGLPVIDAKRPITLHINDNDIAKADRKEPADCAVARACRREFHAKEVRVHLGRVYLRTNAGSWTRYLTPKSMRDEIIAFDRGGLLNLEHSSCQRRGRARLCLGAAKAARAGTLGPAPKARSAASRIL